MAASITTCAHRGAQDAEAASETCGDCGSTFNLRVCTTCGNVGCCESQRAHNRAHFEATGHPVIRSLPLSDHSFTWCYACDRYV